MSQDRCRHCNRVVEFIDVIEDTPEGPKSKRVALDPKSPTYEWTSRKDVFARETFFWKKSMARVVHWATCPVGREKVAAKIQATTFAEAAKELDEKTENEPWWNKY